MAEQVCCGLGTETVALSIGLHFKPTTKGWRLPTGLVLVWLVSFFSLSSLSFSPPLHLLKNFSEIKIIASSLCKSSERLEWIAAFHAVVG